MLTMNYNGLKERYGKPKKQKVDKKYKFNTKVLNASVWMDKKEWLKKLKESEEIKKKIIKAKKENIPTRKEQYQHQLEHPLWIKKKNMILERDHHQCVLCGSPLYLQVHHKRYSDGKRAWEYPNAVLVTLCRECHQKVHSDPNHELNPYKKRED